MTEKEKAKAYDKAIEKAKKLYGNVITEEIFPELKEDDTERIRKNCIHFLELQKQHHAATFEIEECIAWLEKQGKTSPIPSNSSNTVKNEQKPADKIEPKFKVGNWYQCTKDFFDFKKNTAYYCAKEGCLQDEYMCHIAIVKDLYDNFKLWNIQDAKDGDIICYKDEISLYKNDIKNCTKQETTFGGFVYYYCYDGKRFITNSFYSLTEQDKIDIHPATKEQRDTLMKAMNNAGFVWDTEKKELKNKKEKNDIKLYTQYWNNKERLIIVCNEGSVFVDITTSTNKIDKKAFIWGLNISPNSRHIGLGTLLFKYAEECVRQRNISKVEIEWEISSPLWVYDWYIRNSYKEIDFGEGYSKLRKTL